MGATTYSDLDTLAKRRNAFSGIELIKSTGYTDKVIDGGSDYKQTLKSVYVVVTEAFVSPGVTVSFGTVSSSGLYGTLTIPVTAVVGDRVTGTIATAARSAGIPMVIDFTSASGNGKFIPGFEYEYDPS